MTWVAVAIGGSALLGAGASYAGASKQAKGAKNAANLQMQQFQTLNRQQQPFIQSGYGAQARLNTLLGINARPSMGPQQMAPQGQAPRQVAPSVMGRGRLVSLLQLRAAHGDTQAQAMLENLP